MPTSVPDDDIMDIQQSMDLGHDTKSQPQQKKGAQPDTGERPREIQEALERAAYTRERREARHSRALRTAPR